MLRRDLIAQGAIALWGLTAEGLPVLGSRLGDLAEPGVGPLPSRVGMSDVAEIATTTEQLRATARTHGGQASAVSAVAAEYSRLLTASPASPAVATALGSRLAELAELAGWCWRDSGDDHRARWSYGEAARLAREVDDHARLASALRFAAILDAVRGRPGDALKLDQIALEILTVRSGDPALIAHVNANIAMDYALLGRVEQATEQLARTRDGYEPPNRHRAADMDYMSALVCQLTDRKEIAEALAAGINSGGWHRPVGTMAKVLRATIHVQTNEPRGLAMAHEAIAAVRPLHSVQAREKLVPLAEALEARPGRDARELAQLARKVAAPQGDGSLRTAGVEA